MQKKRKLSDLKKLEQPIINDSINTKELTNKASSTQKIMAENKTNSKDTNTKDLSAFFETQQKPASVIFSLYLDINTHAELKEISKKTGIKVNRIVSQFIKDGLSRLKK